MRVMYILFLYYMELLKCFIYVSIGYKIYLYILFSNYECKSLNRQLILTIASGAKSSKNTDGAFHLYILYQAVPW